MLTVVIFLRCLYLFRQGIFSKKDLAKAALKMFKTRALSTCEYYFSIITVTNTELFMELDLSVYSFFVKL